MPTAPRTVPRLTRSAGITNVCAGIVLVATCAFFIHGAVTAVTRTHTDWQFFLLATLALTLPIAGIGVYLIWWSIQQRPWQ